MIGVGQHAEALIAGAQSADSELETVRYDDAATASEKLHERLADGDTVLVKGSRRLGLDRLAARLRERFA